MLGIFLSRDGRPKDFEIVIKTMQSVLSVLPGLILR